MGTDMIVSCDELYVFALEVAEDAGMRIDVTVGGNPPTRSMKS